MSDVFSTEKRSEVMSKIQGTDTKPEIKIRKALHSLGYRYRLYDKDLPGKPDLKLTKYNGLIFVHGCFWHAHSCHLFKWPKTRPAFWKKKILGNVERDRRNEKQLIKMDWRVLVIWECSLKGKTRLDFSTLISNIEKWLNSDTTYKEISGKNS